jgi:hypothetical protein
MVVVAALFVESGGVYATLPGVELWDAQRDARLYAGTHPVVCHSPCGPWSRLAELAHSKGGPATGEDDGCFAAALAAVRRWGGVLEHPRCSKAWKAFGLPEPVSGRWRYGASGYSTQVNQVEYGHRARKPTWLFYVGEEVPPPLRWSAKSTPTHPVERMGKRERKATPLAFALELIGIARRAQGQMSLFPNPFE